MALTDPEEMTPLSYFVYKAILSKFTSYRCSLLSPAHSDYNSQSLTRMGCKGPRINLELGSFLLCCSKVTTFRTHLNHKVTDICTGFF